MNLIIKFKLILLILFNYTLFGFNHDWQSVENKASNTVVQIYSNGASFNWMFPFVAPKQTQGAGSGFFINKEGCLLTNYHVIKESASILAFVPALGRKPLELKIIGICPEADVALLKLEPESLALLKENLGEVPFLELGDSDLLYPTAPVLALGYPLGLRSLKSTLGVIGGREYIFGKSFMHITAPINHGSSGGPLLNKDGKVVGINSAGIREAQNIGYIIPINDVKIILNDLYKNTILRKPDLGIDFNYTTNEHALSLSNPLPAGVYISFVTEKSVGEKIGLKAGDMLYEINGFKVDSYGDVTVRWRSGEKISFKELLLRFPVNEKLELGVYRGGQKLVLKGIFETSVVYPIRFIHPDFEPEAIDYEMFAGLCIMQLRYNHFPVLPGTTLLKQFTKLENKNQEVLVVTTVLPGSMADKIDCFNSGSLIESVNKKKVTNLEQLREALLLSVKTNEISIETKDHYSTVISLSKMLKEEPKLAYAFKFNISNTVKKLWELTQP